MISKCLVALILALSALNAAADLVTITATKKTVDEIKGTEQDLPRGKSRAIEKYVLYRIELQSTSTKPLMELSVEWMILVEGAGGNVFPGTMGQKAVDLPFGQKVTLETATVKLLGREWHGGPSPGTVEDTIAGYGVRVIAADGTVLGERYEPASARVRIDWKLLQTPVRALDRLNRGLGAPPGQRMERMPLDQGETTPPAGP